MSSVGARLGYGTTVELAPIGTSPLVWTALIGVQDVEIPTIETEDVEVTHMLSPNRTREYIQGLKDSGEVEIPILYVPGNGTDVLIRGLLTSGEERYVRFTPPSDASPEETIIFRCFVRTYARSIPIGDAMTATIGLRLNAEVEL